MTQSFDAPFASVVIGNESLLIQCSEIMLERGHVIQAVITNNADIRAWAKTKNLTVFASDPQLANNLQSVAFDWLFSIANLSIIPSEILSLAEKGAINFHDGPLPNYAGLNAPVWALINQEKRHGITWHLMEDGVDEGDILAQKMFDLSTGDTALTLNTKCYEAAIDSFPSLLYAVEMGLPERTPQDLSQLENFAKNDRPIAAGLIDFSRPANEIIALVNGLDHGGYWNPLYSAKIELNNRILLVKDASIANITSDMPAGAVISANANEVIIATATTPIILRAFFDTNGESIPIESVIAKGDVLASLMSEEAETLTNQMAEIVASESHWREKLHNLIPVTLPQSTTEKSGKGHQTHPLILPETLRADTFVNAAASFISRISGAQEFDLAYSDNSITDGLNTLYASNWVPVRYSATDQSGNWATYKTASTRFKKTLEETRRNRSFSCDLIARDPRINASLAPTIGISVGNGFKVVSELALTIELSDNTAHIRYDTAHFSENDISRLASQFTEFTFAITNGTSDDISINRLPILSSNERDLVLYDWNNTEATYDKSVCVHQLFEAQVESTPDVEALVFENQSLSYTELNAQANRVANVLRDMGVKPGTLVGLYTSRSLDMVISALAIQKAGGAYVPLDPNYPVNRIAHFITDSAAPIIITQSDLVENLPDHTAQVLTIDTDPRINAASGSNIDSGVCPHDLAYLIYTSGSTGVPKGVMVEHRNVVNFFTGMDKKISYDPPGVWLAVTSLSFDISVLELFYTLSRGFKVVLNSDESRIMPSDGAQPVSDQKMEFSLYNWGNDQFEGSNKYELLIEGAKFADENGFCAVWTPERHFHAFGGLYPNPSVTGAAVAAVTKNLAVRAGSIVAPLHHPIRIAEEWAVIDNLTGGRVGLSIASGWQPNDFVLRPENTPPENKPAMFEAIKIIRKLWAGEAVDFPTKSGEPFAVVTQPRPLSKKLPIWVTTAGNPETWKEAGRNGANVLTHLLGQSLEEVAEKTTLYHAALKEAGYDPEEFTVTLMLHTYVGADREIVRETVREPMKDYLRSAAGLIKQYAWAFPAFKKPKGVTNPFEINLDDLTEDEMEGVLDYAFERYFEDAGLFGTVEDCLERVEQLKQNGVGEIGCLVDYGMPVETVLEGLVPLAQVLKRANTTSDAEKGDYSIAAQILRHGVTHLQCTPSMARMLVTDEQSEVALKNIQHLIIGGEPLPGSMVADFAKITTARIQNMYGPTETTIWSSTEQAQTTDGLVNIGKPIANTQLYVLDAHGEPVPVGVAGELYIGGDGVTRGYWEQPKLTNDRFLPNPFLKDPKPGQAKMYRTGDLVCWRDDGKVEFLGRVDNQVKLRGHRIELGEIETCLETYENIQQAVVVTREFGANDIRLVAYIVTNNTTSDADIKRGLSDNLPDYMVPSHFVTLKEMPLTPNKKVNRNALPAPIIAVPQTIIAPTVSNENTLENQIAAIWSRILGVPKIAPSDNFFELGGHSLLAVQAHREIKSELGILKMSITDFFRFPTLSALAGQLTTKMTTNNASGSQTVVDIKPHKSARADVMSKRKAMRDRRKGAVS